jgi:hypothetical protein
MFGTLDETETDVVDEVADANARAIRGIGDLAGLMARAFARHGATHKQASPCPDAKPTDLITPCEKKRRELLAKAEAYRRRREEA